MQSKWAKAVFQDYLRGLGTSPDAMTPSRGVEALLSFYRDVRADDCDTELNQDMLLVQWGTYDWGQGERFEFNLTRQLIVGEGEDDDTWQLGLTFRFQPTAILRAVGDENKWCESPRDLSSFEAFIRAHPAFLSVADRTDAEVELSYECAG